MGPVCSLAAIASRLANNPFIFAVGRSEKLFERKRKDGSTFLNTGTLGGTECVAPTNL